jgi:hypothetical protein
LTRFGGANREPVRSKTLQCRDPEQMQVIWRVNFFFSGARVDDVAAKKLRPRGRFRLRLQKSF